MNVSGVASHEDTSYAQLCYLAVMDAIGARHFPVQGTERLSDDQDRPLAFEVIVGGRADFTRLGSDL